MIPYADLDPKAKTGTVVQIGARKFIKTPFRWIAMSNTNEAEVNSASERKNADDSED